MDATAFLCALLIVSLDLSLHEQPLHASSGHRARSADEEYALRERVRGVHLEDTAQEPGLVENSMPTQSAVQVQSQPQTHPEVVRTEDEMRARIHRMLAFIPSETTSTQREADRVYSHHTVESFLSSLMLGLAVFCGEDVKLKNPLEIVLPETSGSVGAPSQTQARQQWHDLLPQGLATNSTAMCDALFAQCNRSKAWDMHMDELASCLFSLWMHAWKVLLGPHARWEGNHGKAPDVCEDNLPAPLNSTRPARVTCDVTSGCGFDTNTGQKMQERNPPEPRGDSGGGGGGSSNSTGHQTLAHPPRGLPGSKQLHSPRRQRQRGTTSTPTPVRSARFLSPTVGRLVCRQGDNVGLPDQSDQPGDTAHPGLSTTNRNLDQRVGRAESHLEHRQPDGRENATVGETGTAFFTPRPTVAQAARPVQTQEVKKLDTIPGIDWTSRHEKHGKGTDAGETEGADDSLKRHNPFYARDRAVQVLQNAIRRQIALLRTGKARRLRNAALLIQRHVRRRLGARLLLRRRRDFTHATTLQATWRGHIVRHRRIPQTKSALKINKCARNKLLRARAVAKVIDRREEIAARKEAQAAFLLHYRAASGSLSYFMFTWQGQDAKRVQFEPHATLIGDPQEPSGSTCLSLGMGQSTGKVGSDSTQTPAEERAGGRNAVDQGATLVRAAGEWDDYDEDDLTVDGSDEEHEHTQGSGVDLDPARSSTNARGAGEDGQDGVHNRPTLRPEPVVGEPVMSTGANDASDAAGRGQGHAGSSSADASRITSRVQRIYDEDLAKQSSGKEQDKTVSSDHENRCDSTMAATGISPQTGSSSEYVDTEALFPGIDVNRLTDGQRLIWSEQLCTAALRQRQKLVVAIGSGAPPSKLHDGPAEFSKATRDAADSPLVGAPGSPPPPHPATDGANQDHKRSPGRPPLLEAVPPGTSASPPVPSQERSSAQAQGAPLSLNVALRGPSLRLSSTTMLLGDILAAQSLPELAERRYLQALKLKQRVLGDSDDQLATLYNNLGMVVRRQRRLEEASKMFERAVAMKGRVHGWESLAVTSTMVNLAAVRQQQQRYTAALSHYERAYTIRCRILGESHPHTSSVLQGLAGCGIAIILGQDAPTRPEMQGPQSAKAQSTAESVVQQDYTSQIPRTAVQGPSRSGRKEAGRASDAILPDPAESVSTSPDGATAYAFDPCSVLVWQEQLTHVRRTNGDEEGLLRALGNLGTLYEKFELHLKASEAFQELVRMNRLRFGSYHPSTADAMERAAGALRVCERYNEALEYARAALGVWEEIDDAGEDTLDSLVQLAEILGLVGRKTEARAVAKRGLEAIETMESMERKDAIDFSEDRQRLRQLYFSMMERAIVLQEPKELG